jgi:Putative zinc-finger
MTHPRDNAIEHLLRERPGAGGSSVRGVCLDVDTLAAWMDDALGSEERAAAESHVADCSRCQALLAAMARTTPVTPANRSWWRRPAFAWALPLTAAAAALVIWIATPGVNERPVLTVADSKTTGEPASPSGAPASIAPSSLAGAKTGARDELKSIPQKQAAAAKKELPERDKASGGTVGRLQAEASRQPPEEERVGVEGRAEGQPETKRDALRQKSSSNVVAAAPPPSAGAPASTADAPAPMAKMMAARVAPIVEIVSSNPGSRWRIVGGRTVERSMDGGSTWQQQDTGVSGTLTAGSSPLPSVCWLVGSGGTVLVTSDGRSWRHVSFPETADLIAIRATDAQSATVTTADGRTFSTTDGGLTWVPA